jgi:hypothetical protein
MSSIIDSNAFFTLLPQLNGNSTLQGTVTALYEIGMFRQLEKCVISLWLIYSRMSHRRCLHAHLW